MYKDCIIIIHKGGRKAMYERLKKYCHPSWSEYKSTEIRDKHYFVDITAEEIKEEIKDIEKNLSISFPRN